MREWGKWVAVSLIQVSCIHYIFTLQGAEGAFLFGILIILKMVFSIFRISITIAADAFPES